MMIKRRKIIGHEKQLAVLAQSFNSNKVFPVWIFWGNNGIGKTSVAYKFAKCLLSDLDSVNDTLDLPEESKIHNWVDNLTHPDFFILDKDSPTMDDVRAIMEKVGKAPSLSKRRVVILANADKLNNNICNSLLKILEEPPKDTVFILVCTNPGHIPITLLSRAIKLKFNPLSTRETTIALMLEDVEDVDTLAQIAGGSIGNALYFNKNNGLELYQKLLNAFAYDYETSNKTVKFIIDNKLAITNFDIIKQLIVHILKIYIDTITKINIDKTFERWIKRVSVEHEVEKVSNIISNLDQGEALLLDKNGMIAEVFEVFFERNN